MQYLSFLLTVVANVAADLISKLISKWLDSKNDRR